MQQELNFDTTTGQQQWIGAHGAEDVVREDEVSELQGATARIWAMMEDRQWHTADEIRMAAGRHGVPASEGLRRMRDLRKPLQERGLAIEKRRGDSRMFEYRIAEEATKWQSGST